MASTIKKYVKDIESVGWQDLFIKCIAQGQPEDILTIKKMQPFPQDPQERKNIVVDLEGFSEAAIHFICWAVIYGETNRINTGSINKFIELLEFTWGKKFSRTAMYHALNELEKAGYIETLFKTNKGSCYLITV